MPIQTLKVGSLGTHNTLGLAKDKGARFLLASTSEVYGDPQVHPQPEDYWGNVNPIGPRGVYDEAKRFAEAMTMAYHRYHGLDVRIVRIFNTYGPRMRPDDGRVVSNFLVQALARQAAHRLRRRQPDPQLLLRRRRGPRASSPCSTPTTSGPSTSATPTSSRSSSWPSWCSRSPARRRRSCSSRCRSTTPRSAGPTSPWPAGSLGWEPEVELREGLARTAEWLAAAAHLAVTRDAPGAPSAPSSSTTTPATTCVDVRPQPAGRRASSDIVVVDNASRDGSVEARCAAADPDVDVVRTGAQPRLRRRRQPGRGRATDDATSLVLNPDAVVEPGRGQGPGRGARRATRRSASSGPASRTPTARCTRRPGRFPDLVDAAGHAFLGLVAPGNRFTRRYRMLDWDHAAAADVDWVSGACMLVRRRGVRRSSAASTRRYFMYVEDVDLCWRARRARLGGGLRARRPGSCTCRACRPTRRPYRMIAAHHRSLLRFWWRDHRPAARAGLLAAVVVGSASARPDRCLAVGPRGRAEPAARAQVASPPSWERPPAARRSRAPPARAAGARRGAGRRGSGTAS